MIRKEQIKPVGNLPSIFKETDELLAIIAQSINTAKSSKAALNLNVDN